MSLKKMNPALIVVLAVIIVFTTVSCEKLKVSRLQANHYFSKANQAFTEQKYRIKSKFSSSAPFSGRKL